MSNELTTSASKKKPKIASRKEKLYVADKCGGTYLSIPCPSPVTQHHYFDYNHHKPGNSDNIQAASHVVLDIS